MIYCEKSPIHSYFSHTYCMVERKYFTTIVCRMCRVWVWPSSLLITRFVGCEQALCKLVWLFTDIVRKARSCKIDTQTKTWHCQIILGFSCIKLSTKLMLTALLGTTDAKANMNKWYGMMFTIDQITMFVVKTPAVHITQLRTITFIFEDVLTKCLHQI